MGLLDGLKLPTLGEMPRGGWSDVKKQAKTRLEAKVQKRSDESKDEARWKAEVWRRDGGKCRWCGRAVLKTIELLPERGEVHHVSGRVVKAIRWDRRNGILLCYSPCHERVTGRVGEKFLLHGKSTFTVDDIAYLNADRVVRFKRIA